MLDLSPDSLEVCNILLIVCIVLHFCTHKLIIGIHEATTNFQILRVNVAYGYLSTIINIFNIDSKSPMDLLKKKYSGSFGEIYKTDELNFQFALKTVKIDDKKFGLTFKQVIKEFFFLVIASALSVGPKVQRSFGFDIVVFRDCLCFSMQFCEMVTHRSSEMEVQLKSKLHLLHILKIIHLDIKPENIAFSPFFNEYVFIDFGLSKVIKEPIGAKTETAFTGSFNFCSSEMLELYVSDSVGPIDLYYNDAYSLNKSIRDFNESSEAQPQYLDEHWEDSPNSRKFYEYQCLIKVKYAIFQLSLSQNFGLPYLLKNRHFLANHKPQLDKFILTLPKSYSLINFYRKQLDIYETIEKTTFSVDYQMIQKGTVKEEEISLTFYKRFDQINAINSFKDGHQQIKMVNIQDSILFDQEKVLNCNRSLYMLILIKFIKISNICDEFSKKITACKIFNKIHFQNHEELKSEVKKNGKSDIEVYKDTIKLLFEHALASTSSEALEILKNSIQTIVILEIVSEEQFVSAFKTSLERNASFMNKISLAFEFVISLQFVKEKYRKLYNYNRLMDIFMTQLNHFILNQQQIINQDDERQLAKRLKFIISHKIKVDYQSQFMTDLNQYGYMFSFQMIRLHQDITMYLLYNELIVCLDRYSTYSQRNYKNMLANVHKTNPTSNAFNYLHFAIFHVSYHINTFEFCQSIYSLFYEQFRYFKEYSYFGIHFVSKLIPLNRFLYKAKMIQQHRINEKIISAQQNIDYQQIFTILNYIVEKTQTFHNYLGAFLNILINKSSKICSDYIFDLYRSHKNKLLSLSSSYEHKIGMFFHQNTLKREILATNQLFSNLADIMQDRITETRSFIQKCLNAIHRSSCFACKTYSIIQVKIFESNYISASDKDKSFWMVIDCLILHMKNDLLQANILPILALVIQKWHKSSFLFSRYDLRGFIYQTIKANGKFQKYLMEQTTFNIFLNVYVYIASIYPEEEIAIFVYNILSTIANNKINSYIDNFYISMNHLININKSSGSYRSFALYHIKVIEHLLTFNLRSNPYVSLYFSVLLPLNFGNGISTAMLKQIGFSFNRIGKYAKVPILNRYYDQFSYYLPVPPRKSYYLCLKHLKYSNQKVTLKHILKSKLKKKVLRDASVKNIRFFKKSIMKYHENIGNNLK